MSLSNGWTGGQYSIFRVIFGTYLAIHFAQLMPWAAELFSDQGVLPQATPSPFIHLFPNVLALFDGPVLVTALLGIAVGLSILFAIGWHDRWLALLLWYIWACLFGRNPLISNPSLPFVGWMLVAHAFLPQAPYGSWSAHGRPDPGGNWQHKIKISFGSTREQVSNLLQSVPKASGPQQPNECATKQSEQLNHPPRASPDSLRLR